MTNNSKIKALKGVPLFAHCSTRQLAEIAKTVDEIDLPEGRTLTREGLTGKEFVVLAEGIADVESGGAVVNTLGPGDFFGEISLVTGLPRTATVTTRSPARLLVLSAPAFRSLLARAPRIRRRVVAAAALRLAR
ncbi:MAG TPA: cyclic nucleotide-binding domain-containing protein [Gaiellaceae bacterium]|jgi:CRP-like cAMP-binding protein